MLMLFDFLSSPLSLQLENLFASFICITYIFTLQILDFIVLGRTDTVKKEMFVQSVINSRCGVSPKLS